MHEMPPKELLQRFEALLRGYREALKRQTAMNPKATRFAILLDGFLTSRNRWLLTETAESQHLRQMFETRLTGYLECRERWAASQVKYADGFNLFEVMEVEHDELTHSKVLAWLLDRRIERGTHAQGNLGFRLFLEELQSDLGLAPDAPADYSNQPYWVSCEVRGETSRIDIEIAARSQFIVHIENKIDAAEGQEETNREWEDLQRRQKELDVSPANVHAIYLTLDGDKPGSEYFHPVGWRRLAAVLDLFAEQAQAEEVKLFARHYAKAICALAASPRPELITEKPENGEETIP